MVLAVPASFRRYAFRAFSAQYFTASPGALPSAVTFRAVGAEMLRFATLTYDQVPIHRRIINNLHNSAGPFHFNLPHSRSGSKAHDNPWIIRRQITARAVHVKYLLLSRTVGNRYPRADPVAIRP